GAAEAVKLGFQVRHRGQVRSGERGDADDVDVVLDCLARGFLGRGEEWADVDVEAEIGERGGDDLLAAVVAVLADLGDQDARPAPLVVLELGDALLYPLDRIRHADLPPVHARYRLDLGAVAAEHLLQRRRDFADRGLGARRIDGERQQIAVAASGGPRERRQRLVDGFGIALAFQPRQLVELQLAHRAVVDLENVDRRFVRGAIFVDADHRLGAGIDAGLGAGGGLLDAQLRQAGLDRARHAAELFDFADVAKRARGEIVGQALDIERAAPRIDGARQPALAREHDLGVAGDAGGEIRGQRQRLVERVGMQRLRAARGGRHGLDAGPRHVVEYILGGERPARRLAMGAQRQRARIARLEVAHQPGPQRAGGAQLRHLHEKIHADAEEERDARREAVDVEIGGATGA